MFELGYCLTLVSWVLDHLSNHGLHNGNVSVESATNKSRKQRDPEGTSHAEDDARHGNTSQANQRDRFPAVDVGDGPP